MRTLQDKLDLAARGLEPILWELLDSFEDETTIFETAEAE
jgi:hypothetical protein